MDMLVETKNGRIGEKTLNRSGREGLAAAF